MVNAPVRPPFSDLSDEVLRSAFPAPRSRRGAASAGPPADDRWGKTRRHAGQRLRPKSAPRLPRMTELLRPAVRSWKAERAARNFPHLADLQSPASAWRRCAGISDAPKRKRSASSLRMRSSCVVPIRGARQWDQTYKLVSVRKPDRARCPAWCPPAECSGAGYA
jgi:hypothetical protein